MSFKKFPSLTNHYVTKDIKWWLERYPELRDEVYIVREKIHGSNIQLNINRDGEVSVCSRNLPLVKGQDSFNGIFNVLETRYSNEVDVLRKYANSISDLENLRVYGEFFGGSIQKGVNYGQEKRIKFFTMALNDRFLTDNEMSYTFFELGIGYLLAPVLGMVKGIENAINFDVKKNTTLFETDEENIMEGGVIQPVNRVFFSPVGEWFCLKKKNKEFEDKKSQRKRDPKEVKDDVEIFGQVTVDTRENFLDYVNEVRVESVFSKYGEIQRRDQLGEYIKLVIEDAVDTFKRENEFNESDFDKKQLKYIFNCGKLVVDLLKKELE